jgi:hypothetical protein
MYTEAYVRNICIIERKNIFVSDYGAYPNDHIDDANTVQLAINSVSNCGLNTTVIFGYGTYYLSSTITILNATDLTNIGQGIDQTFLVGTMH